MSNVYEMTFGKLTKAIAKRVREIYPEYKIHLEYPSQGLDLPCFVLRTSGGNLQRRISQGKSIRGLSNERFTLEFYSLDIAELQQVSYEIRLLLDVVTADDGEQFRCINKNTMMAITEHHVSITFRVLTTPYIEAEPIPNMTSLDMTEAMEINGEVTESNDLIGI